MGHDARVPLLPYHPQVTLRITNNTHALPQVTLSDLVEILDGVDDGHADFGRWGGVLGGTRLWIFLLAQLSILLLQFVQVEESWLKYLVDVGARFQKVLVGLAILIQVRMSPPRLLIPRLKVNLAHIRVVEGRIDTFSGLLEASEDVGILVVVH